MTKYDTIVVGAGNAGLIAALRLAKSGKKVLVLESNNVPGGFATSFIRGRFEFEAALHELCDYGNIDNQGSVYKLFKDLGLEDKITFVEVPEAYHVYSKETNEDFVMPFGVREYMDKMEEYVPGSRESMEQFFQLCKECREALKYLENNKDCIDQDVLFGDYSNFMKVAANPLKKVLNSLKMPEKAQEIMTTYWTYLGSPASTLSFIHFSSMFYSYITKGAQIPKKTSHEISVCLAEEIEKENGVIKYLSTVESILFSDDKISGVRLTNGKEYYADHVICAISPTKVYGNMIPTKYLPKNALKLTNSRVLGARGFSIYLGLNQSAKDIGLNDYSYFIYHNLDSDKEYKLMNSINNDSSVAVVINNANKSCSPKGTCIMNITSLFFGDCFDNAVTVENYYELKEQIADSIINQFEETTGISIREYIEEIEIATPVTFARYGGHPDGVIYGYKATGLDNLLPRIMNMDNENYIDNLRFCGGFGVRLSGYSSTYLSGNIAALQTLGDMKGDVIDE